MNKSLVILLFVATMVSACTTNGPAAAPETQPRPAEVLKTDFVPTEPTTVNLAMGKPQFIEFFAFW